MSFSLYEDTHKIEEHALTRLLELEGPCWIVSCVLSPDNNGSPWIDALARKFGDPLLDTPVVGYQEFIEFNGNILEAIIVKLTYKNGHLILLKNHPRDQVLDQNLALAASSFSHMIIFEEKDNHLMACARLKACIDRQLATRQVPNFKVGFVFYGVQEPNHPSNLSPRVLTTLNTINSYDILRQYIPTISTYAFTEVENDETLEQDIQAVVELDLMVAQIQLMISNEPGIFSSKFVQLLADSNNILDTQLTINTQTQLNDHREHQNWSKRHVTTILLRNKVVEHLENWATETTTQQTVINSTVVSDWAPVSSKEVIISTRNSVYSENSHLGIFLKAIAALFVLSVELATWPVYLVAEAICVIAQRRAPQLKAILPIGTVSNIVRTIHHPGLRVVMVDASQPIPNEYWFDTALRRIWAAASELALYRFDHSLSVSKWSEAAQQLKDLVKREGKLIKELQFWGHGCSGGASIGHDCLTSLNLDTFWSEMDTVFEPNALLWFRTCNTLQGEPGRQFAAQLSTHLGGIRIAGHNTIIGAIQPQLLLFKPGDTASWTDTDGVFLTCAEMSHSILEN